VISFRAHLCVYSLFVQDDALPEPVRDNAFKIKIEKYDAFDNQVVKVAFHRQNVWEHFGGCTAAICVGVPFEHVSMCM
jgi:hypothetical protein